MIDWDAAVVGPTIAVFGEPVTYTPASGSGFTVSGVFDNAYRPIDQLTGEPVPMMAAIPVLGVRARDFAVPPAQGDRVLVQSNGLTYLVKEANPDSHGQVLLKLSRVSA